MLIGKLERKNDPIEKDGDFFNKKNKISSFDQQYPAVCRSSYRFEVNAVL